MALSGPTSLVATPLSPSAIQLTWQNNGQYDWVFIERKSPVGPAWESLTAYSLNDYVIPTTPNNCAYKCITAGTSGAEEPTWPTGEGEEVEDGTVTWKCYNQNFVEIEHVDGSEEEYHDIELGPNTRYDYRVRGYRFNPEEWSDYSNEDDATTYANLEAPSNIETTVFSDFIEITWEDNSSMEDVFCIERKTGAGAFSEIDIVERNREYFRDTTVSAGTQYTYRVRARQNPSTYSGYVTGSQVTSNSAPSAPSSLAITEKEDKRLRLTWTGVANETGYKIYKSTNGSDFTLFATVGTDITEYLVTGLDPSTQYWFKVLAYNGVGNSGYSNTVNDTTLAQYAFTEYEKFIRSKNIDPVYLAELELKMDLTGFTLVSGKTYTYEKTVNERGITIHAVYEDGTAYTEKSSIADVEANASSFYFDYDNQKVYVHTSNGTAPSNFLIEGAFWKYFSNGKNIVFNGNHYLNLLRAEDIPDISQEIKAVHEGSFALSTGSIAFMNRKIKGEHFFDKRFERYSWEGSTIILKAGKEGFAYTDYKEIFTAFIGRKSCNDMKATFTLRDIRQDLDRNIILNKYSASDYPAMDEDFIDTEKPKFIGFHSEIIPVCIDKGEGTNESRKYHFNDGRSHSVSLVKIDDIEKTKDTDYFVDPQRSIITFADGITITEDNIIKISFMGFVNSADEAIENGAEVFKYTLNDFVGMLNSELNHDFIYETKYANTESVSIPIYKDTPFNDIIKTLEKTTEASILQDNKGRFGIRPRQTTPLSNAKVIEDHHEFPDSFSQERDRDSLYWKVVVNYREDIYTQTWLFKDAKNDKIKWRYGVEQELLIDCYFHYGTQAQTLATNIMNILNKGTIDIELPMLLFDSLPGDIVKFTRARFYNVSGSASNLNLRILSISKSPANRSTTVTMEPV